MNVTQAATPPAKWITHGYFANQIYTELQTVKLVPTDQPALNILPPRQFCSLIGWQVKRPSNVATNFFTLAYSAYDMVWKEWPNILSTCKIIHMFDIAARDVYCSTINVTGIKKCIRYTCFDSC